MRTMYDVLITMRDGEEVRWAPEHDYNVITSNIRYDQNFFVVELSDGTSYAYSIVDIKKIRVIRIGL